jgi:beta-lactamase superfamily II metal-dependent hydrolase
VKKVLENWGKETLDDSGETSAENNSSTITLFHFNDEYLLFTGDAGIPALTQAVSLLESERFDFSKLKFIQVPHHGSQRNIGPSILNKIIGANVCQTKIKTAFVSAAKDGEPKHPSKKVSNAFLRRGAPVFATQGKGLLHHSSNIPLRAGWISASSIQLYTEVEE